MTVRSKAEAAVGVTSVTGDLAYDLRWYDESESLVPLWWLGVREPRSDELIRTEVLGGPRSVSPLELFAWLAPATSDPVATHLVGLAFQAAEVGPSVAA